jgi:hypothetical protein
MGRSRDDTTENAARAAEKRSLRTLAFASPLLALTALGCPSEVHVAPSLPTKASPPAAIAVPPVKAAGYVLADPYSLPPTLAVPLDNNESFGVVLEGIRLVAGRDGARKAPSVAHARLTRVDRIPARLGGGFVFAGGAALYRSDSFEGPLTPLAALSERNPISIKHVSFGPKGALVRESSGHRWSFALPSWTRTPIAPVGLVDIAALSDGRALAITEIGQALTSTNAGERWDDQTSKLASPPRRVTAIGDDLWIHDEAGRAHRLERGGSLREFERSANEPARETKDPRWRGAASPQKTAVLFGAPERAGNPADPGHSPPNETTAIVAAGGDVARVDMRTGAILSITPGRLPPAMTCAALATAIDVIFVCSDGRTSVVASGGLRGEPVIERTFDPAGTFFASDDGGILFGGPCASVKEAPRVACARSSEGAWTEHNLDAIIARAGEAGPAPDAELVRWIARADGPPLAIMAADSSIATVDLETGKAVPWKAASLADLGIPLQPAPATAKKKGAAPPRDARPHLDRRWSATRAGSLVGWVAAGRAVSISATGAVTRSPFALSAGSMSGARALGTTPDGRAFQTLNHGLTWTEVDGPPTRPKAAFPIASCSDVGCDLGVWLRIGWPETPPSPAPPPEVAASPPVLPRAPLPEMVCSITGEPRTRSAPGDEDMLGLGASQIPPPNALLDDDRTLEYWRETFSRRLVHPAYEGLNGTDETAPRFMSHGFGVRFLDDVTTDFSFEVLGPARAAGSFRRTLTFVAPLDPAGSIRSVNVGLGALTPLQNANGASMRGLLEAIVGSPIQIVPALPLEPGGAVDLVIAFPLSEGQMIGLLSTGAAPRLKLLAVRPRGGSPVSAALLPGGNLALLSVDADDRERVLRVSQTGIAELAEIPGIEPDHQFAANPDALAIGPDGSLAVLRTPSGEEPARIGDPALLLKLPQNLANSAKTSTNSIVMETLAPWSTLAAAEDPVCSGDPAAYRAILQTQAPWVRLRGSRSFEAAVSAMSAVVRWGTSRVCLEAIELPDAPLEIEGKGPMEMTVVARFARPALAGRLGVRLGSESRQPLSCALSPAAPPASTDPLNMR